MDTALFQRIKITKIEEVPFPWHPHNIMVGQSWEGHLYEEPEIGDRFHTSSYMSTSPVQEIIDENTFKTLNSIYRIERLPDVDEGLVLDLDIHVKLK